MKIYRVEEYYRDESKHKASFLSLKSAIKYARLCADNERRENNADLDQTDDLTEDTKYRVNGMRSRWLGVWGYTAVSNMYGMRFFYCVKSEEVRE